MPLYYVTAGDHVTSDKLVVTNGMNKGEWGEWELCPVGSYAAGVQLEVCLLFLLYCRVIYIKVRSTKATVLVMYTS